VNPFLFTLGALLTFGHPSASQDVWHPSPGHTQIAIWPGAPPDAQAVTGPESPARTEKDQLIADKPWAYIERVSRPTMTVYFPTGKNTGAAVVVFPGGGYRILAIDLEGTEVCDWLVSKGITCVLLKYRVPFSGPHWEEKCNCEVIPKAPLA
jgi:acetyl esterase/lipase